MWEGQRLDSNCKLFICSWSLQFKNSLCLSFSCATWDVKLKIQASGSSLFTHFNCKFTYLAKFVTSKSILLTFKQSFVDLENGRVLELSHVLIKSKPMFSSYMMNTLFIGGFTVLNSSMYMVCLMEKIQDYNKLHSFRYNLKCWSL